MSEHSDKMKRLVDGEVLLGVFDVSEDTDALEKLGIKTGKDWVGFSIYEHQDWPANSSQYLYIQGTPSTPPDRSNPKSYNILFHLKDLEAAKAFAQCLLESLH